MSTLTPTAYIQTRIDQKPENDGWFLPCDPMGYVEERKIQLLEGEWSFLAETDTYYLKPINLSRMLEEAFKRGWYDRGYDRKPLKEYLDDHINSVLNPPK